MYQSEHRQTKLFLLKHLLWHDGESPSSLLDNYLTTKLAITSVTLGGNTSTYVIVKGPGPIPMPCDPILIQCHLTQYYLKEAFELRQLLLF